MTLASQSPGVDPQLAALLALFAGLGAVVARLVGSLLEHVRKGQAQGLSVATLQQKELMAILDQAGALREEMRKEIERLQARLTEQEQQLAKLQRQVAELRAENLALRQMLQKRGGPEGWRPVLG